MKVIKDDTPDRISKLVSEGKLWDAHQLALRHIHEEGEEDSQFEIFQLAKILYSQRQYHQAYHWIKKTIADPIQRIPLQEKIERKLRFVNVK